MKKPDIEYGIHKRTGCLKIWCNCKNNKDGIICKDCAKYFIDKLKEGIDKDLPKLSRIKKGDKVLYVSPINGKVEVVTVAEVDGDRIYGTEEEGYYHIDNLYTLGQLTEMLK